MSCWKSGRSCAAVREDKRYPFCAVFCTYGAADASSDTGALADALACTDIHTNSAPFSVAFPKPNTIPVAGAYLASFD